MPERPTNVLLAGLVNAAAAAAAADLRVHETSHVCRQQKRLQHWQVPKHPRFQKALTNDWHYQCHARQLIQDRKPGLPLVYSLKEHHTSMGHKKCGRME